MRAHEFVQENKQSFNWEIMQPGFEFDQEINGVTYKVTNAEGQLTVMAYDQRGNVIGHAVFWKHQTRSGLESLSTEVNDKWQGKGIAANMYAIVRMLGANINPSLFQTKQGKRMWKKWQQQGDVAQLKNMNAKIKDQSVAETINSAILNKRFRHKQVIGDYTYKASVEMFMGEPLLSIKAYDGDREIGHILFEIIVRSPGGKRDPSADYIESGGTEVDPAYRNKGVASTMYAYAKMLGNDVRPSYNQTSQGQAMWAAWNKAGDAKHLIGTAAESTMAENFADGKIKGKSRPGRVKRAGASCNGSVTDLRARAKNASGEKAKMYHWCANMKSGRKK
jgi:YD repeat-containing protein